MLVDFRKVLRTISSVYLVYFWGFCPFQFFCPAYVYSAITKNISESTCTKSTACFTHADANEKEKQAQAQEKGSH